MNRRSQSRGSDERTAWMPPAQVRAVRRRLLAWYDRTRRDLPWRRRQDDAYAQLVAELMLQQTQVATVVAYYERFMKRFPTVQALADAEVDDVLALWSGLGYYRRARSLHAAARKVVTDFEGRLPAAVDALMTLPGVGRYTAGAIASVAFGTRAAVLDGNVARVLTRLLAIDGDAGSERATLWELAEMLLPRNRCGDFNQALMELGATVCSPRSPDCLLCPLRVVCRAQQLGLTDRIPAPAKRTRVQPGSVVVGAVRQGDRMLFVQRPATGLWAGLWELPTEPVADGEAIGTARARLRRHLPRACRLSTVPTGQVTRQLTHRRITFHLFEGVANGARRSGTIANGQSCRWLVPDELSELGISRACEAVLGLLEWGL